MSNNNNNSYFERYDKKYKTYGLPCSSENNNFKPHNIGTSTS